jgi:hypothetical protein
LQPAPHILQIVDNCKPVNFKVQVTNLNLLRYSGSPVKLRMTRKKELTHTFYIIPIHSFVIPEKLVLDLIGERESRPVNTLDSGSPPGMTF